MTHQIEGPLHVYVQEDAAGEAKVVDIEDRAGVKTLIMFDSWTEIPQTTT